MPATHALRLAGSGCRSAPPCDAARPAAGQAAVASAALHAARVAGAAEPLCSRRRLAAGERPAPPAARLLRVLAQLLRRRARRGAAGRCCCAAARPLAVPPSPLRVAPPRCSPRLGDAPAAGAACCPPALCPEAGAGCLAAAGCHDSLSARGDAAPGRVTPTLPAWSSFRRMGINRCLEMRCPTEDLPCAVALSPAAVLPSLAGAVFECSGARVSGRMLSQLAKCSCARKGSG